MRRSRSPLRRQPASRIVLHRRDWDILETLFCCRVLTCRMIQDAFFSPSGASRSRRRLRQLFDAGMVDRYFLLAGSGTQVLYTVGVGAVEHVRRWCGDHGTELTEEEARKHTLLPSPSLLRHTLALAEVYLACRRHLGAGGPIGLDRWLIEPLVRAQFDVREAAGASRRSGWRSVLVKPDAALQLSGMPADLRTFFIEADCGTETSAQLATKLECHRLFMASGQFTELYGEPSAWTLVATTGTLQQRGAHIAAIANRVEATNTLVTTIDGLQGAGPLDCPCLLPSGEGTTVRSLGDKKEN